jgi:two-component system cell cycle sensor histidine kinase/response regulator CckA
MESIGRLAGGVAHDFNNLLTAILGNVQLALDDLPGESALNEYLIGIHDAAEIAASLTRQLLAFSRRQIIEPQLVDLNDLITRMQKMLTRLIGEDVALKTSLAKDLGTVKVDPGLMEQVIINLSVNARDAMPDGGTLLLETANVSAVNFSPANASTTNASSGPGTEARHPLLDPGEYVVLSVSDSGTGIPTEARQHLFEPFYTTKPKGRGTGLGLATTYGAVKQSGGHIDVQSEEGKGTTFKIFLPRVTDRHPERPQPGSRAAQGPQSGSETILLVEDDPMVRSLAIKMLEHHGYRVLQAADGGEALLIADRHREPIDLLMTDLVMPGMNGRLLAERFKGTHPEARVLMSSGYAENVITHHGVLEEGVSFICKPYTLQGLGAKVRQVLDRS